MGLYDRDYMQGKPSGPRGPSFWTAVVFLLILGGLVALFILRK